MFLVFLLYGLFASVFTIAKTGLEYTQPFFLVGSRMMLAGLLMLGYQFWFKRNELKFNGIHIWRIVQLAVFNIFLTNAFEFWGLKYLSSSKTCFLYSLSPFVSALLSYMMFSEKMTSKKWLGLIIGFAGFIPILLSKTAQEESTGSFLFFSWAEASVMMAAICGVYGWILLKQLVKENGYSPITANGLSMLVGGTIAIINSVLTEDWNPIPVTQFLPFFECAILLIIISNMICYNLYGFLLKKYSATFMSFAGITTPLFAAIFGWFFLGDKEIFAWPFYISGAIVFFGLYIFYQEEIKQGYLVKPSQPVEA